MKKALITGVLGQDGAYLSKFLLEKGYQVFGCIRRSTSSSKNRLQRLGIENQIEFISLDLTNQDQVSRVIKVGQYDEIYNLAAESSVVSSWDFPVETSLVNAIGPLYLLDAIRKFSPASRYHQASTTELFQKITNHSKTAKTTFQLQSPYAIAKQFSHSMTCQYREAYNIYACCGIFSNHESPLRGSEFVTKKITEQVANYKVNGKSCLSLGNIDLKRDWGYAPEYVEGMWLALQNDQAADFIFATGYSQTIRRFVEDAFSEINVRLLWEGKGDAEIARDALTHQVIVRIDPKFYRPTEPDLAPHDTSRSFKELGWKPTTNAKKLAKIMVQADIAMLLGDSKLMQTEL